MLKRFDKLTIDKIREVVNAKVPGVGRGIVDYAIKNLGINIEAPSPEELKKFVNDIVKHIKTLYGIKKANSLIKDIASFLPDGASDITII